MEKADSKSNKERDDKLLEIAKNVLFLETLETRNLDRYDFHEHSVCSIKEALEKAYQAGRELSQKA